MIIKKSFALIAGNQRCVFVFNPMKQGRFRATGDDLFQLMSQMGGVRSVFMYLLFPKRIKRTVLTIFLYLVGEQLSVW